MAKGRKSGQSLVAALESTVAHLRDQAERDERQREQATVYQLAFWPDHQRAMPTDFLACALFAGVHLKNANSVRGEELACINGYRVTFTGKMLTQVHADIVMGALQLMRGLPEGSPVMIRTRAFLRSIGRHTGKSDRDSFRQLVDDVIATAVRITTPDGKLSYSGSILTRSKDAMDGKDNAFLLEVNRDLARLFLGGFGTVDWQQRRALMKKPLALWLQLYVSKFSKPVRVAELHRLSRSAAPLRSFRRQLKLALLELERVGVGVWFVDADDVMRSRVEVRSALVAPAQVATLPGIEPEVHVAISEQAKRRFRSLYPGQDPERCLADWHAWPGSRRAEKPDAAWLGFAKRWVIGRSA